MQKNYQAIVSASRRVSTKKVRQKEEMSTMSNYKLHHAVAVGLSASHGRGTFATRHLDKGTLLMVIGGHLLTCEEEAELPQSMQDAGVQIASNLVLSPRTGDLAGGISYVNHSCDPNAGFKGQIFLVAMRDIAEDEEITFDYAMCLGDGPDAEPYRLECHCGSAQCRGAVTDTDWMIPELQSRYQGFFQPYLQARIEPNSELLITSRTSSDLANNAGQCPPPRRTSKKGQ